MRFRTAFTGVVAGAIGAALLPLTATAGEEVVTFKIDRDVIVGTLSLPEGGPAPVVLLFHGFTGTRNELPVANTEDGVFSRTARLLADAGYASLRIDFRGSGDSSGTFDETTFDGQIADGIAAMEWLAANPRVKGDDIAVIGWSQGGLVAAAVAGRSDPQPDALMLWAAVASPEETFRGLLGDEVVDQGFLTGDTPLKITLPWGAEIGLRQGFFDGLRDIDTATEIAAYKGPLFVAHGTKDTTVLPAAADVYLGAHDGVEEYWSREMDHVFNAFTGPETLDEMVAATITFLDAQMK